MERITTIAAVRRTVADLRHAGARIGLVPTMGALHPAHLALVAEAASVADAVVVSVFVNPTQFDRPDDLQAYPRDLVADEEALASLGADAPAVVFAPSVDAMYPATSRTTVHVSGMTERLCGASRPGHFDGVATIVTKLLHIVQPDVAVFGRKDRQQLAVIEQLVADLDLPVRIVGAPTVRDTDGVALSSRNRLLDADGRHAARALSQALAVGVQHVEASASDRPIERAALVAAVTDRLAVPGVTVDYVELVAPDTMQPPQEPIYPGDHLVLAVAAYVGDVRLIDNVELGHDDAAQLLRAIANVE